MSLLCLTTDNHIRGRDWSNKEVLLKELVRVCEERKVDRIINLGDTFDKGEVGDKYLSSEKLIKGYTDIFDIDIPITMLEGNHDIYGLSVSALDFIHLRNTYKVKDKVEIISYPDYDLACIPWLRNNKNYMTEVLAALNNYKIKDSRPRILVGHLNIINCSIGKHGYCTPEHYFSFGLPDLASTKFAPTSMYFGHIHKKMDLGWGASYLGALSQLRFDEDEGKASGFHLLDTTTGVLEFIDLSHLASNYYTINEVELLRYNTDKDYIRFYTENPERYKHLAPGVKAILRREDNVTEEAKSVYEQSRSDELTINNLVARYCLLKEKIEPTSDFYLSEKTTLSVGLVKKPTGFDRVKSISLKNIGPHKNTKVEFKDGFTCILGSNGKGKTFLMESIVSSLYDYYPTRGNIKNSMVKDSKLELELEALGSPYMVTKTLKGKQVQSSLNEDTFTLVNGFGAAVEPIFGDDSTFKRLVFMDQSNQYDLVTAKDSERLKLFRELFDLSGFDKKHTEYNSLLSQCKKDLEALTKLQVEIDSLKEEHDNINYDPDLTFDRDRDLHLRNRLSLARTEKKKHENNLILLEKLNKIKEYESNNNIKEIETNIIKINVLESRIRTSKNWKDVGCKGNPLPCVFLKNHVLEDYSLLEKELTELQKCVRIKEHNDYKYLKTSLGQEFSVDKIYTQEDVDKLATEFNQLQIHNHQVSHNEKLKELKNNILKRIRNKEKELVNYSTKKELEIKIKDLQFLVEICGKHGLSLYIINLIKAELQQIINELIEVSELNLLIDLSTNKKDELDTFKILFGEERYDVNLASGGEIALVRVIFKLAIMKYLNRYFGTYKVIIGDEISAALDDSNTEAVIDMIKLMKKEVNQIILISHDAKIANAADNIINLG